MSRGRMMEKNSVQRAITKVVTLRQLDRCGRGREKAVWQRSDHLQGMQARKHAGLMAVVLW